MLRSRLFFFIRTRVFSFLSSVERLSVVLMSASLTCTNIDHPATSLPLALISGDPQIGSQLDAAQFFVIFGAV